MGEVELKMSEELKHKTEAFPEINWTGFVEKSIKQKVEALSWKEKMLKKLDEDKAFEDWCVEMGREVNKGIAKRLKKEGLL